MDRRLIFGKVLKFNLWQIFRIQSLAKFKNFAKDFKLEDFKLEDFKLDETHF